MLIQPTENKIMVLFNDALWLIPFGLAFITEAYSEPYQTSMMESFAKIAFAKRTILDVWGCVSQ